MHPPPRSGALPTVLLASIAILPGVARAQDTPMAAAEQATMVAAAADTTGGHDITDVGALEAWLDGFMASHLDELPSAGANLAVVKDGRVLLAKGYGLADVENDVDVDANTLFRIGSVSKLFTWTSIMQLVERGRLDLDTDINEYMGDIRIPDTYPEPVTLAHLLTHTAGFEDHVIGLFGSSEESLRPLEEILRDEMPARVRPPGEVASYSNHGTGMAAYIVERTTGMSFSDYMQANILDPLRMDETTILQPVPERLAAKLSKGYTDAGGGDFEEEDFEFVPLAPVGAVSSSANDMAKLMIAYLQLGRLGDARILSEETARRMRRPLFRHADVVNPALHGFMDMSQDGQWIIGHGGDTFWFHTLFALLPDHDLGVYVSYNTESGSAGRGRFLEAFLARYLPVDEPPELVPDPSNAERLRKYAGPYRANRYAHSDFTKVAAAIGPVTVSVTDSGAVKTSATGSTEFVETGPGAFRETDGRGTLAFRENADGEVTHMFLGPFQVVAFERATGLGSPGFQTVVAGFVTVVFVLAVLFWPITALVRWRYGATPPPERRLTRWARLVGWLAAAGFIAFLVGLGSMAADPNQVALGDVSSVRRSLGIGLVAAVLGVGMFVLTIRFWIVRSGSTWTRVVFTVVAVACVLAIWQMSYWNLLGFRM